jgi:hypothetical protein
MSRHFLALPLLLLAAATAPAGADDFDSYWASLSREEQALVDRVAADIFEENRMGAPTPSFKESGDRRKARFRAKAMKVLGVVRPPKAPPMDRRDI